MILAKINVPEAFKTTIQEMRDNCDENNAICHFGIQESEYHFFADKCAKNNVKICETGPELETNLNVQGLWKSFECRQHKRRRCFIKEI
jgi:hypothetical protein